MYPSLNARALGLRISSEETIDLAARFDFKGVDLLLRDILQSGTDPRRLRARMDANGVRGGAFPLPVEWRGTEDAFERDLARLPVHAEIAETLGLTRTGTWVMPETPAFNRPQCERAAYLSRIKVLHLERLGAIARVLDRHQIRIGLEVIGVASSRSGNGLPFIHRLGDLDRILGDVWGESSNLGVLVDAFHLYASEEPVETALAWGIEKVVWVHVADLPATAARDRSAINDLDRGLPGENGAVETPELLRFLKQNRFDGPITAEPMAGCRSIRGLSPTKTVERVAEALRSVWPD